MAEDGNPDFADLITDITAGVGDDSGSQVLANNIGVQGQVFTVDNDEDYFYPNLIDGMLVDEARGLGQGKCVVLICYCSYFLSCSKILTCCDHFSFHCLQTSQSTLDPVQEMVLMTNQTDHCPVMLSHLSHGRWTASVSSSPLPRWTSFALTSSVVLECVGVVREWASPVNFFFFTQNNSLLLITKTIPRMDRLAATLILAQTGAVELLTRLSFPMTSVISTTTAQLVGGSDDVEVVYFVWKLCMC